MARMGLRGMLAEGASARHTSYPSPAGKALQFRGLGPSFWSIRRRRKSRIGARARPRPPRTPVKSKTAWNEMLPPSSSRSKRHLPPAPPSRGMVAPEVEPLSRVVARGVEAAPLPVRALWTRETVGRARGHHGPLSARQANRSPTRESTLFGVHRGDSQNLFRRPSPRGIVLPGLHVVWT